MTGKNEQLAPSETPFVLGIMLLGVAAWAAAHVSWVADLMGGNGGSPTVIHAMVSFWLVAVLLGGGTVVIIRRGPHSAGVFRTLGLSNRSFGVRWVLIGAVVAILAGIVGSRSPAIAGMYPLGRDLTTQPHVFGPYMLGYLAYYVGFEFFFRGLLLFHAPDDGNHLKRNLLQSVLATMFHIGKPLVETGMAFPSSLIFGWLALRTGSIWYGVAAHWFIGMALDIFLITSQ